VTDFARPRNMAPGEGSEAAAPLRKVTLLQETRGLDIAGVQGHPLDQGVYWPLIARYVNGAEEFDVGIYRLDSDEFHPSHYHPAAAEFYYFIEGSCRVRVDDDWIEATPGTAVYLPAGTVHAVRTRPGETTTMVYGFSCGDFRDAGTTWVE
jgi:quercetin dioxygenase-like cupin family protein